MTGGSHVEIFFSYAREDERWKQRIEKHLEVLRRRGDIKCWNDRRIEPGKNWSDEIDSHIETAHIILLLISADFLASDYCHEIEMKRALEREREGTARVIPVILRDVDWSESEFAGLNALPQDGKPIRSWSNPDKALANVARGIRVAVTSLRRDGRGRIAAGHPGDMPLTTKLITDPRDADVRSALDLYEERIPAEERFEAPDIVRWLREDVENRIKGGDGPFDYFIVAKLNDRVCGFTLFHYYPAVQLAFVAYLVAEWWGVTVDGGSVSAKLLEHVSTQLRTDPLLRDCTGFVLEVDDPARAASEEDYRQRLARIRLFCTLAEMNGFTLRALDLRYLQPHVRISPGTGEEVPMLLMYAADWSRVSGSVARSEAERILRFICEWLYPEGFSPVAEEVAAYRQYLDRLCSRLRNGLPERIRTLSLAEIRERRPS